MHADTWIPGPEWFETSNLAKLMQRLGAASYDDFLASSVSDQERYWAATLEHLQIRFDPPPKAFLDVSEGKPWARFFPGAGFNYAAACVQPPADDPHRIAVSGEDEDGRRFELTYADLQCRTRRFASGLSKLGVRPGDRVGFLFPNTAEAVISFLAIGWLGAIAVPLYSGFGAEAIARRLVDAQARVLIAAQQFVRRGRIVSLADVAVSVQAQLPAISTLVLVREANAAVPAVAHHAWSDVESDGDDAFPAHATLANDPFMVIYTSGTTGKPKGAVHVHAGFPLRVAQDVAFCFDFRAGDRFFWMSDMGWMVGPFAICSSLLNKGTLVLYDGSPDVPSIGRLRDVAARHGVTHFGSSPTSVRAMALDERSALGSAAPALRVLMTGGEVMDAESHHWYFQKFGGGRLPIINYTGGTEVSGALLTNVVLRPIAPSRFNSTAPGVPSAVIDESGQRLKGAPGELAILAPFVGKTQGFWGDRERYLETYWSRVPDVWVHGDLAIHEADGQYLVLGRSDDVMKISGKRVGPSEVEGTLVDAGLATEAVVFGVPDALTGEAMVVLAVPAKPIENAQDFVGQVRSVLLSRMGPTYRPKAVVAVRQLVKTRNGKLVRRLARQAWQDEPPGDLTAVEDPGVFDRLRADCRLHPVPGPK